MKCYSRGNRNIKLLIMKNRILKYLLITVILVSCLGISVNSQSNTLITFSLEDQFNEKYTNDRYIGYYLILVGGDRKGAEYCFIWSDKIHEELKDSPMKDKIKGFGVADLMKAPSSLKSVIISKFPKEKKHRVLLDWEGLFNEAYSFKEDVANVIIFNPEGKRIYSTTVTNVDKAKLDEIISVVRAS